MIGGLISVICLLQKGPYNIFIEQTDVAFYHTHILVKWVSLKICVSARN